MRGLSHRGLWGCARRFLYKLGKPTNFPVTPELAAELDALTIEQIEAQFRCVRLKLTALNPPGCLLAFDRQ